MGIEIVVKIAVIGLLVAIINQILSKCGRDEYALLVTLAGLLVVFLIMIPYIRELTGVFSSVLDL